MKVRPKSIVSIMIAVAMLTGCQSTPPPQPVAPAPQDAAAPQPGSTGGGTPAGTPAAETETPPTAPLTVAVSMSSGGYYVEGLDGYIAVSARLGAWASFRFSAPMDRGRVEADMNALLAGLEHRYAWFGDQEAVVHVKLPDGATVTLDPAGLTDRWGRRVASGHAVTLKAFPEVAVDYFTYDPETDEAHPFTGEQMPGVFTEGLANPNGGRPLLLWARQPSRSGAVYRPYLVDMGRVRPLPGATSDLLPRFYACCCRSSNSDPALRWCPPG